MPQTPGELLRRAKAMRRELTPPERALWHILRAKRLDGAKFSRQVVIAPYIADFAARARRLVVELDCDSHGATIDYDARRTAFLERAGYRVIRFINADVLGNPEGVAEAISHALAAAVLPGPLPDGERE